MVVDYHQFLGTMVQIRIDRPIGSRHPTYGYIYPVHYGYIPDTSSEDGAEIDVYLLGIEQPIEETSGVIIGIAHRRNDIEDKLIATVDGKVLPREFVEAKLAFQEQYFETEYERLHVCRDQET
ncbi:MAG: hypothetical protein KDA80_21920 [Planctomycetaceae bacterium]|nr:hypothetical protein [Planctomycetaceae bacterium]